MIRIGQLKIEPNHSDKELVQRIAKTLRVSESDILNYVIQKQSIDARKKPDLKYVYTVDVAVANEGKILEKNKDKNVSLEMFLIKLWKNITINKGKECDHTWQIALRKKRKTS